MKVQSCGGTAAPAAVNLNLLAVHCHDFIQCDSFNPQGISNGACKMGADWLAQQARVYRKAQTLQDQV